MSESKLIPWGKLIFTSGDVSLRDDFVDTLLFETGHCFGRTETIKKDLKKFPYRKTLINRPFVSGTHFTIQQSIGPGKENMYSLRDSSSNGTFLNGEQIKKETDVPLAFNDTISLRFKDENQLVLTFVSYDETSRGDASAHCSESAHDPFSLNASYEESSDARAFASQIKALKAENKMLEEQLAAHVLSNETNLNVISDMKKEVVLLSESVDDKAAKIGMLEASLKDTEAKASSAEARCVNLEDSLTEARTSIRSLKTQLSAEKERDKDNSNLEQTIKQLRNDLDMRSKQLDTRQALNDELSQQMSREKSLTKRLHQDVYKEQNKLIELQRLYTMRDTMLKNYKERLATSQTALASMSATTAKLSETASSGAKADKDFSDRLADALQAVTCQLGEYLVVKAGYAKSQDEVFAECGDDGKNAEENDTDEVACTQVATVDPSQSVPFFDRTPMVVPNTVDDDLTYGGAEDGEAESPEKGREEDQEASVQFHFTDSPAVSDSQSQDSRKRGRGSDSEDEDY